MSEETVITDPSPTAENVNPVVTETTDEVETLLGPEETPSPETPVDEKKTEVEPKKAEVPEKYDVKLPDGVELDVATLDLFSPIFKELGISNEGAQKLVDAYVPLIQSTIDKQRKESQNDFKTIVSGWHADTMKELGPDAKQDLAACGKALNKFGSKELREMLQETGVGNHKELVKFMAKIGKTISEDSVVTPKDNPVNLFGPDPKKMYPSMTQ